MAGRLGGTKKAWHGVAVGATTVAMTLVLFACFGSAIIWSARLALIVTSYLVLIALSGWAGGKISQREVVEVLNDDYSRWLGVKEAVKRE